MNEAGAPAWSTGEHFDPMVTAAADQDFGNLIDFDSLDLDFSIDYANGGNGHAAGQQLADLGDALDVQHLQGAFTPPIPPEHHEGAGATRAHGSGSVPHSGNNAFDFNVPRFNQAHASAFAAGQEHMFRQHPGVPPTPNSIEMHGDAARYLQQLDPQSRAFFEQRYQMHKDDAATFTPLVSPAVTPHEARFQVPDFTVPGAYFSPLTSPALAAQNQQRHQHAQGQSSQYTTSGSSAGTSPVDVDVDMLGEAAISVPDSGRKLRNNKRAAPRASNAAGRVRQSPIVKPTRRKTALSSVIPPKEVSDLVEEAHRSNSARPTTAGLPVPRSRDGSEAESTSPEPLSGMGPPPKPSSVTHSPAISANLSQTSTSTNEPATPASLMRLQQSPNFVNSSNAPMLDDLTLPEAANSDRPSSGRMATVTQDSEQSTPRLTSRKTPKLGPLSTPSAGLALSGVSPSPISAMASPTSPGFALGMGKRHEPKLARNLKKRNSTSSTLVSPALRPKISPSIKPLLPEGAVADDTHALLLASKSNYQNILDGTTVPGVSYPTSLSTNLTSKRTSHKIAEQGRRNRINMALQEMQALLPSPQLTAKDAKDAKSPDSGGGAQSNNSKAAKVESAIEYIKELQKQCSEKDDLINEKDQQMELLRKELAALKRSDSLSTETDTPLKAEEKSSPEVDET